MPTIKLVDINELAKLLAMRPQTIFNWMSAGRPFIPSIKVGALRRWRVSDVEAWVQERFEVEQAEMTKRAKPIEPIARDPNRRKAGRPRKDVSGRTDQ